MDNPLDKLTNADNYRELRKMIGTQEESAAALGVTRKTIINRENKKERVTREAGLAIRELARIIGYEPDDL